MLDLFISYSSADHETARALVTDFENRGITCWIASRDVPMGGSYQQEIVKAIEQCRALLLLFSKATNESEHVLREVELAAQGKKPIYPLRIDIAEPAGGLRYMLANKQWVERKALGNRLVDTIEQLLAQNGAPRDKREDAAVAKKEAPRGGNAGLLIGAAALVLMIAAGAFGWRSGWFEPQKPVVATPAPVAEEQTKPAASLAPPANTMAVTPPAVTPPVVPPRAADSAAAAPAAVAPPAVTTPPYDSTTDRKPSLPPAKQTPGTDEPPTLPPQSTSEIARGVPLRAQVAPGKPYLFQECEVCPVMAAIPAGSNLIGSPDEERGHDKNEGPQQEIVIAQPFAVGRSEVSFAEWLACVAEGGCNSFRPGDYGWGTGERPVINVSWDDARAYAAWLSKKTGAAYRLLSEAEWEYVARGCVTICRSMPFWFGADISKERANYDSRYSYGFSPKAVPLARTADATSAQPNPFGLMHIHGNVREWVEDCWNPTLATIPRDGSARMTGDCQTHVVRGGSWADEPKDLRSAARAWELATERRAQIGFRIARALPQ